MSHEAYFGLGSCQLEFVKLEVPLPTFLEERTLILFKTRVDLCGSFAKSSDEEIVSDNFNTL